MSTPTVTVNPLVWERSNRSTLRAAHLHHTAFLIDEVPGEDEPWRLFGYIPGAGYASSHPTLEAAQAAAQTKWDAHVRAAITVSP